MYKFYKWRKYGRKRTSFEMVSQIFLQKDEFVDTLSKLLLPNGNLGQGKRIQENRH